MKELCKEYFKKCRGSAGAETVATLIVSLILLGSAAGTVVVPILLELVQSVKDALGVKPGANERGSALFTMGSALGSIVGNWVGGALYKEYKNPITCDIMAAMSFTMGILYFLMNIWPGFLLKKAE
jgi:predicted MFS family arabinose efflux permease